MCEYTTATAADANPISYPSANPTSDHHAGPIITGNDTMHKPYLLIICQILTTLEYI